MAVLVQKLGHALRGRIPTLAHILCDLGSLRNGLGGDDGDGRS